MKNLQSSHQLGSLLRNLSQPLKRAFMRILVPPGGLQHDLLRAMKRCQVPMKKFQLALHLGSKINCMKKQVHQQPCSR